MIEVVTMKQPGRPLIVARAEAAVPPRGTVDVRALLHWAIGHQKAHKFAFMPGAFDLDRYAYVTPGVDSVAIVEHNGRLGTFIDSSPAWHPRNSGCDEDAAKVFDQVRACLRSWPIYRLVMAHAELGTEPDWKPHVVTSAHRATCARVEPVDRDAQGRAVESDHTVQYGVALWRAVERDRKGALREVFATGGRRRDPRLRWRYVKLLEVLVPRVRFTPLAWHDMPDEIVAARRAYSQWHAALKDVADSLNLTPTGPHALDRWSRVVHTAPAHPWPLEDDARLARQAAELARVRRELLHHEAARDSGFDLSSVRPLDREGGS